jgi:hypothetical protein
LKRDLKRAPFSQVTFLQKGVFFLILAVRFAVFGEKTGERAQVAEINAAKGVDCK